MSEYRPPRPTGAGQPQGRGYARPMPNDSGNMPRRVPSQSNSMPPRGGVPYATPSQPHRAVGHPQQRQQAQQRVQPQRQPHRAPPRAQSRGGGGGSTRQPRKRRGLWGFFVVAVLLAALCVGSYFFVIYRDVNRQEGKFYDGIYASGIHLGGMTPDEAFAALNDVEAQQLSAWQVALRYQENVKTIDAADIDLRLNLATQLDAAWAIGRTGGLLERWEVIKQLRQHPYASEGGISYDRAKLNSILELIKQGLTTAAVDATSTVSGSEQVVTAEQYGSELDIEPIRDQIEQSIYALASADIELQPRIINPSVTANELQGQHGLIVAASTVISKKSEDGRTENIRVALSRLDGQTIQPGKKLSFNEVVGKRTIKNGFREADEIEYGQYVRGVGGGVCQASTTLYQAAVRSGMQIDERGPHAIPSNYCEMGQDATVSDNKKDLVIRNISDAPMYIRAYIDETGSGKKKTLKCVVEIYGKPLPDGIRYVLESQQIGEPFEPNPDKRYEKDRKQEHVVFQDQEWEAAKKRLGYKVKTYLVKQRSDHMEIDREEISTDTYPASPAIIYVGTTPRGLD